MAVTHNCAQARARFVFSESVMVSQHQVESGMWQFVPCGELLQPREANDCTAPEGQICCELKPHLDSVSLSVNSSEDLPLFRPQGSCETPRLSLTLLLCCCPGSEELGSGGPSRARGAGSRYMAQLFTESFLELMKVMSTQAGPLLVWLLHPASWYMMVKHPYQLNKAQKYMHIIFYWLMVVKYFFSSKLYQYQTLSKVFRYE